MAPLRLTSLLFLLSAISILHATTSEGIYRQYCASCHFKESNVRAWYKKVLVERLQIADKEERTRIFKEMHEDMDSAYVAPPFSKVVKRLTSQFDDKAAFVSFVRRYIKAPSREKGHCKPFIFERFGVMPPIDPKMSDEEIDKIANWLYDSFRLYHAH